MTRKSGVASRKRSANEAADRLAAFYRRNGYVRLQDPQRVEEEGSARYKKGDEVRLVAASIAELRLIRQLLKTCGFGPGRPFKKGRQYRVPIYGRREVVRFMEMVRAARDV